MITCLLTLASQAQEKKKKPVVGIKAGLAITNLSPDYTDSAGRTVDYKSRITFVGGIRAELPLGKNFLLLPELNLVNKLSKQYNVGPSYNYSSYAGGGLFLEFTLNFLKQFPISTSNIFLGAGPSAAINTNRYSVLSNSDFGLNVLAGCKLSSGFSIELNFNKGLKHQHGSYIYEESGPPNLTTSALALSLGYTF